MNRLFFSVLLISVGFLFSCGEKVSGPNTDSVPVAAAPAQQTVHGKDFSMQIGSRLSVTDALDSSAVLQYQDYETELYLIVTEEPKADFIERARKENQFRENQTVVENACRMKMAIQEEQTALKTEPGQISTKIGGLDAVIVAFAGKPEGMDIDIFYKAAFIDGGDKIYTVMIWTLDTYKPQHLNAIDQMLFSFRKENPASR